MVGQGFGNLGKLFIAGVVAVALVTAGCGSSDDSGGEALSATAYAQRAEALCKETGDERTQKIEQLVKEQPAGKGTPPVTELGRAVKPIFEDMIEELEDMEPPSGKKGDQYREWVEAVEEAVDKIDAPDPQGLEASVKAHHKAKAAGLEICSLL